MAEGLLARGHLNRCTQLLLAQGEDYLLFGKRTLLHGKFCLWHHSWFC